MLLLKKLRKRIHFTLYTSLAFVLSHSAMAKDIQLPPANLPTPENWKNYFENDLLPFWIPAQTLGEPGNFSTYRCNNGQQYNEIKPCEELANPAPGVVWLNREYLRMKSRQIYGYGVAYHLTGNSQYLDLAKQGVDYLVKNGFETVGDQKAPITYWETTDTKKAAVKGPPLLQRNSQDMAYSLSGIGFYYYLTRDPEALKLILSVKNYIFATYFDTTLQMFRWVKQNFNEDTTDKRELTAQLDQIYAYMIWLTPSLPLAYQAEWKQDLIRIANLMKKHFYAGDCKTTTLAKQKAEEKTTGCGLFWGNQTPDYVHQIGKEHNDYGHSIKTMWMIYTIGKIAKNKELEQWGYKGASQIIPRAYDTETGSWKRDPTNRAKEWWILCELDETTASLALKQAVFAKYLPATWKYWNDYMVDKNNHEVWNLVKTDGKPDKKLPKQHAWKNMMHTAEHALVGYITASELHQKPATLYFAWKEEPPKYTINPYIYEANIDSIITKNGQQKVIFSNIH